eukprot:6202761-Alexandrium_andersonii.AAC.1
MSASLVGSEMCIRDSPYVHLRSHAFSCALSRSPALSCALLRSPALSCACLLYTSDAADDM